MTTIVFKYGLSNLGGGWAIYELLPGFILSTAVLLIVSAIDKKGVSAEMAHDYDKMLSIVKSASDDLTLYDEEVAPSEVEGVVAEAVVTNEASVDMAQDIVDNNVSNDTEDSDN